MLDSKLIISRTGLLRICAAAAHATETSELREIFDPYPPPILRTLTLILKYKCHCTFALHLLENLGSSNET
jgi:hypothetical protein